jgi:hypothetical protein
MPRSLSISTLVAILTAQITLTSALFGHEQGSYYVFDLVDSDASEPIMGRLAIPATAITAEAVESAPAVQESQSEFEIKIDTTMRTTTNSSFELGLNFEDTADADSVSFSTESFDLGTHTTEYRD